MRDHKLTQKIFRKGPNEMETIAAAYRNHLSSTRQLEAFQEQYKVSTAFFNFSWVFEDEEISVILFQYLIKILPPTETIFKIGGRGEVGYRLTELLISTLESTSRGFQEFYFRHAVLLLGFPFASVLVYYLVFRPC